VLERQSADFFFYFFPLSNGLSSPHLSVHLDVIVPREHERGQMDVLQCTAQECFLTSLPNLSLLLFCSFPPPFLALFFEGSTDEAGEDGTSVRSNEVMFEAPDRDIAHEVRLQERQVMVCLLMHSLLYFAR
jgi:hypothetical protein